MKKIALVLAAGIIAAGTAFADHPDDQTGIGFVLNTGYGSNAFVLNPGLSLKVSGVPIFWGIFVQPSFGDDEYTGIGLSGDYYFFEKMFRDETLTNEDGDYHLRIDWYAGIGAYGNFLFRDDKDIDNGMSFGIRVPAGLSWHIVRQAELAIGIVPNFGWEINPNAKDSGDNNRPNWAVNFELALRYWISPASKQKAQSDDQPAVENEAGEETQAATAEENA